MSSATQYLQKKLIDHTLGLASYTMPTAYLALLTANPGETGSLSSELTGTGYARVEITSKMSATSLSTGISSNSSVITFPTPGAAWGFAAYWAVCDASSGGNVLLYGALDTALLISGSDFPPNFIENTFAITASFVAGTSDLTAYLAKKWLDHALGKAAFAMPTAVYLGLFTSDPGSSGSQAGEVSGGSYGRQEVTSKMVAAVLATGIASSDDTITFATPTAAWGTISYYGLLDALSGGNMLFRRARESALVVSSGGRAVAVGANQLAVRAA